MQLHLYFFVVIFSKKKMFAYLQKLFFCCIISEPVLDYLFQVLQLFPTLLFFSFQNNLPFYLSIDNILCFPLFYVFSSIFFPKKKLNKYIYLFLHPYFLQVLTILKTYELQSDNL